MTAKNTEVGTKNWCDPGSDKYPLINANVTKYAIAEVYAAEISQNTPYSLATKLRFDELRSVIEATVESTIPAAGPSHIMPQKVNIAFAETRILELVIFVLNWKTKAAIIAAETRVIIEEIDAADITASDKTSADIAPSITISHSAFASNLKVLKV
jgi:hypothetical protein